MEYIVAVDLHRLFPGGQLILGKIPNEQRQVHAEKCEDAILEHLEGSDPALNSHGLIFFKLVLELTNVH